jgi:hypothetical protein
MNSEQEHRGIDLELIFSDVKFMLLLNGLDHSSTTA